MALTEMSLPVDIPWKRMGVSADMIDPIGGDLQFPAKWQSSIAVFYHEPPEVRPEYCDRRITYLKIICTITNFQWYHDYETHEELKDVSVLNKLRDIYQDFYAFANFDSTVTQSFPCYGAFLQVGVYPNPANDVEPHDFPYISAMQPRKREMYEVVSLSGEVASQSGTKVNVGKQMTNTDTLENYDVYNGYSVGTSSTGFLGIGGSSDTISESGQFGTIDRNQRLAQNVTSIDSSREKRESYSHSTNVNQLYSLLQAYHLGTNRAMFFLQPRPHIQDMKFTFVRGLRRLDGIQEFFLIVDRPARVPGICVEAALETAHFVATRAYNQRLIPLSELYDTRNLYRTAAALGLNPYDRRYGYGFYAKLELHWNRAPAWLRRLVGSVRDEAVARNQLQVQNVGTAIRVRYQGNEAIVSSAEWASIEEVATRLPEIGIEDVALIFEEYESDAGWFFVTGRRLHACTTPQPREGAAGGQVDCERSDLGHVSKYVDPPSITFEKKHLGIAHAADRERTGRKPALDLNRTVESFNGLLWSSLNSTQRQPYGARSFMETEFVLDELAQLVRLLRRADVADRPLREMAGAAQLLERGLGRTSGCRTAMDLGTLTTRAVARDLDVGEGEARRVRRRLLLEALRTLGAPATARQTGGPNPVEEKFAFQHPPETLRELEESAHLVRGNTAPEARSGFSPWRRIADFFAK